MLRVEPSTMRAARRTTRDVWFDHAVLAVAFVLLLSGFNTVLRGRDWWVTSVLVVGLTGLTCAVLRAIGTRWVAPVALVVEFFALSWIFVPSTLLWVFPTPGTLQSLGHLIGDAQRAIVEEQAPVPAAQGVVLVIAGSFGLMVILADTLLERRRSAETVGLLLLAVFVSPALSSGKTPKALLFVLVAGLWLMILRSRSRERTTSGWRARTPALVVAGAALGVSMLLPPALPDIAAVAIAWGKPPPSVFGGGINPMLELGQNLRRNNSTVALTYTTSLSTAPYLKVATLRDFTGKTWKPSGSTNADRFEGKVGLFTEIEHHEDTTKISIKALHSSLLPVPYPAQDVVGLKGSWKFERMGMTIRSANSDTRGQTYTVTSLTIAPTAEQMRSLVTVVGPSLEPFVTLPAKMPPVIAATASRVTANASTEYDKALALQSYLRDGHFRYSETAPVTDGYDGNGVDVIAEFLKKQAGYCVHFSSAMAVMARTLNIPSRIAVGYAPGEITGASKGLNVYQNTSDDLHAWTELYFEGAGWIGFDPTTSVGTATAFTDPNAGAPAPGNSSDPANKSGGPNGSKQLNTGKSGGASTSQTAPRAAGAAAGALLLLAITPGLLRSIRRRWRLRQGTSSTDPLWRELEDTAQDFGIRTSVADTPRGFATRLRDRPGIDVEALDRLLLRVESTRFSRAGTAAVGDGVNDLRAIAASVRAGASRRERLRASAFPRSLAGRRAYVVTPGLGPVATS